MPLSRCAPLWAAPCMYPLNSQKYSRRMVTWEILAACVTDNSVTRRFQKRQPSMASREGVLRSARGDVGRRRHVAVLQPLHADAVIFLVGGNLIQAGHENLQAGLRGHSGIAVYELVLIVGEIQVKPGVVGAVHHHQIDL